MNNQYQNIENRETKSKKIKVRDVELTYGALMEETKVRMREEESPEGWSWLRALESSPSPLSSEVEDEESDLEDGWQRNHRKVEINTDSSQTFDYLIRGCQEDYPFYHLVEEARSLLMQEWEVALRLIPRELNHHADRMAKLGHSTDQAFVFFEEPPDFITETTP